MDPTVTHPDQILGRSHMCSDVVASKFCPGMALLVRVSMEEQDGVLVQKVVLDPSGTRWLERRLAIALEHRSSGRSSICRSGSSSGSSSGSGNDNGSGSGNDNGSGSSSSGGSSKEASALLPRVIGCYGHQPLLLRTMALGGAVNGEQPVTRGSGTDRNTFAMPSVGLYA